MKKNILSARSLMSKDINLVVLTVVTVGTVVVMMSILGNKFFSASNLQSMAYQIPEFGFIAFAMMLCMLTGGIDLSVVSIATISSILAAITMTKMVASGGDTSSAILAAVLLALCVASVCGFLNGVLIAHLSILPILATLSTMILYSGIAMAITGGAGVTGFPRTFIRLGIVKFHSVPVIFIMFIAASVLLALFLSLTKAGKNIYLYGENSTVSLFSGIRNSRVVIITYTMAGLLCGIAALIMMSRVNSARVGYGETYLLQAILVCALGGVNPNGGKGKVIGVVVAIIVLQLLQSGFTLLDFAPFIKSLIWGGVLIIVMIINYLADKR
jgi:simple sugar transport system permease protein